MWHRQVFLFLVFAGLVPNATRGQFAEEDEGESIKISAGRPASGEILPDLVASAKIIVTRTNDFRRNEGHRNVEVNLKLTKTAQYFADFMARTDKYGHHADGHGPAERAKEHDYDYCSVSENIAYQFSSAGFISKELAKGYFQAWKHSPGHPKNMLDADVTQTGVSVARSEQSGYYYAVQMFGRPKSMNIEVQITNNSDAVIQYSIGSWTFPLPPRLTRSHQRCRPTELTIKWPDEQESTAVQTRSGDHFTIVRQESGKLHIREDRAKRTEKEAQ